MQVTWNLNAQTPLLFRFARRRDKAPGSDRPGSARVGCARGRRFLLERSPVGNVGPLEHRVVDMDLLAMLWRVLD